jgi:hypothetical protein
MKPQVGWTGLWQGWLARMPGAELRRAQAEEQALREEMEAARRELEAAESYFHTVTDPELVDHAIFAVEAARRKYLYLYRRVRRTVEGVPLPEQEEPQWS